MTDVDPLYVEPEPVRRVAPPAADPAARPSRTAILALVIAAIALVIAGYISASHPTPRAERPHATPVALPGAPAGHDRMSSSSAPRG